MKKRVLTFVLAFILIFAQIPFFASEAEATSGSEKIKIQLSIDKQSVRKGQTFYLTYNFTNASMYDVSYLAFSIYYNSADFEYCEFIANSANHFHSGYDAVVDARTNKISIEFKANADTAYFHGQSKTASIAFKMKYKGSGYITDSVAEFYIGDVVVKSEADYTYTAQDYAFASSEIATEGASIRLTALSDDNTLADIELAVGGNKIALEPAFDPDVTEYTAYVIFSQGGISANFPANHSGAGVSHNFSQQINTGSNNYFIVVTAENGSIRTYNINLHLIPQGMTVQEYKDYLAALNAPPESEPTESEPEVEVVTETDTEPDAPIIEDVVVSPTEPVVSDEPEEPVKSSGGVKGFLEGMSPAVLIGILGGLIVLVAGGFTAGYIAHKKIQREKMISNYLDYYSDDYYDDGYTDYGYADEYYEGDEYYDEY